MTSSKSISPLRQRLLDDMTMRKLTPQTRTHYLRAVERLAKYPDFKVLPYYEYCGSSLRSRSGLRGGWPR